MQKMSIPNSYKIDNLDIVDYKGLKNFKLENLSQINIISGENNIGKTALLEALFLYFMIKFDYDFIKEMITLDSFLYIAKMRDINSKSIKKYLEKVKYIAKSKSLSIKVEHKNAWNLTPNEKKLLSKQMYDTQSRNPTANMITAYTNDEIVFFPIDNHDYKNEFESFDRTYTYIDSSKPTNKRLVQLYSKIQSKGIQHKFLKYLQLLDADIEWIEPQLLDDEMLLRLNLNNPERSLVSSELGEGTNRYIEILATLLTFDKGVVFIDEIENGIHYTKHYDIWKAIIEIVEKEDIQLFVTTHDFESIEALKRASADLNYNKITSIKLEKNKNSNIYPIIRPFESFFATIDSGMDIR